MKKFKHVKLGWIAIEDDTDPKYVIYKTDESMKTQCGLLIDKELVENSNDWEEVKEEDWIDKVIDALSHKSWIINDEGREELRKYINELMPYITEDILEHMEYEPNIDTWREYLKEKGLYSEGNKDENT